MIQPVTIVGRSPARIRTTDVPAAKLLGSFLTVSRSVNPTGAGLWLRRSWTVVGLDITAYVVSSVHPSDGGVGAVILCLAGMASIAGVGALADWPGFVTMSERTTERMAA